MYVEIITWILALIIGAYIALYLRSWYQSRLGRLRLKRGSKAEKRAVKLLKRNGFKILEAQYPLIHNFVAGDEEIKVDLKVDYLVERKGKKYLAEVKSGTSATRAQNKDTRRQLLEYHFLNPFDGLLLVDMEQKVIKDIEFRTVNK